MNNNDTIKKEPAPARFKKWLALLPGRIKKWVIATPLYFKIAVCLAVLCALIHILCNFFPVLADFMVKYPNAAVRWTLAHITSLLPFSLAEMVIILLPLILILLLSLTVYLSRKEDERAYTKYLCFLLSVLCIIYSLFVLTLAPGYKGSSLASKLNLKQKQVSAKELYDTSTWLSEQVSMRLDDIAYDDEGFSHLPYSLDLMCDKLNDAYAKLADKYDFVSKLRSNIKYVILSKPMTYTHISGVYTFYTGEANLNVNFPDYTLPYTAAHELAHQRGTAPENEANFVAFLACMESDDPYIEYSGYINMLEYCMNALYEADSDMYYEFYGTLEREVVGEFYAYSGFYDEYRENVVADVSGTINDTYLQSQGQTAGSRSYGLVVDLAVAYYRSLNSNIA